MKKQRDDIRKDINVSDIPDLNETIRELQRVQEELDQVRTEQSSIENQLKRAVADYQNLEKRVAEGRSELTNWATTELLRKLLVVLDHLEKALDGASEQEKDSGWYKGMELAVKQFQQVLKDEGLEEIPADGVFDPALHEAVDMREGEHDKILEVAEKGYNLNGKVLRPAKVIVGRQSS